MGDAPRDPQGRRIRVSGVVQGVGFRPTVWRLATDEGLRGHVLNDGRGVEIEAFGELAALERFCVRLVADCPPLARIDCIETEVLPNDASSTDFSIVKSSAGEISTAIAPDAATCPACLSEVLSRTDRRSGYPFANCTHCGPRLTIVTSIPYDRDTTTMRSFDMCPACRAEYEDPRDRRYHAQPIACPECGPKVWLEERGERLEGADVIPGASRLIGAGLILAVKGLGGFHLACDASNEGAVARLRTRKHRWSKPLALMVRDVEAAAAFAHVSEAEASLLKMPSAPIVLLKRRAGASLAPSVAPGLQEIGVMLPYTPLHHLLIRAVEGPLVMTSGNLSEEPQCIDNEIARVQLSAIADGFVMHDRIIANRLDDSVVRAEPSGVSMLRRARGFAPEPLIISPEFSRLPPVLALGGEPKSTFCFLNGARATLSQHLGDLGDASTQGEFEATLGLYRKLFDMRPDIIAVDLHPNYASTRIGEALAEKSGARIVSVQHHHAHFASVLAEHGVGIEEDATLGIILDGTGLGTDGEIWGGEILFGGYREVKRVGSLAPVRLLGGERAAREPWRMTVSHLRQAFSTDEELWHRAEHVLPWLRDVPLRTIDRLLDRGLNSPLTTSVGRLFDAVAGALDVCRERQSYEGEAAIRLEALARLGADDALSDGYPISLSRGSLVRIDVLPMWQHLLADLESGVPRPVIAARFHAFLSQSICAAMGTLARDLGAQRIALSGGVFQNGLLLDHVTRELESSGFQVLSHHSVPANDGGISLGQAAIAAAKA